MHRPRDHSHAKGLARTKGDGIRAPIALQVSILLLASLVGAQALVFVILLVSPPPRPPIYRLTEVAEALGGGTLQTRDGYRLLRSLQTQTPVAGNPRLRPDPEPLNELAAMLHVSPGQVKLWRQVPAGPRPHGLPPDGPSHGDMLFEPPPIRFGRPPEAPVLPPDWRRDAPPLDLFFDFTAALQRPDGQWLVVRPVGEAFPTTWEWSVFSWFVGCMVIVASAGLLFGSRITAPLNRFAEAAQRLGRDPNAPPMTLSGPAEIRRAALAFNEMQDRLRRYVEDRTGMVGAISHDLRTPLARIKFKLETPRLDKEAILSDVQQMEEMIAAVLAFIRDASDPRARRRLNLLSLVECAVDDAALQGGEVRITEARECVVDGDVGAIQRVFANLLVNALKFGSTVEVRLLTQGGDVIVEVEDDGPGLDLAERERVFTPFYRTQAARTLDGTGVGLGLSVARSIVRAHGGDLTLDVRDKGLVAIVRLPVALEAPLTVLIAVGTAITGRPPHRSGLAQLRHPAPTSGGGGEAHSGPGMKDPRLGEPVGSQSPHAIPCEAVLLATSPERTSPQMGHPMPER